MAELDIPKSSHGIKIERKKHDTVFYIEEEGVISKLQGKILALESRLANGFEDEIGEFAFSDPKQDYKVLKVVYEIIMLRELISEKRLSTAKMADKIKAAATSGVQLHGHTVGTANLDSFVETCRKIDNMLTEYGEVSLVEGTQEAAEHEDLLAKRARQRNIILATAALIAIGSAIAVYVVSEDGVAPERPPAAHQ